METLLDMSVKPLPVYRLTIEFVGGLLEGLTHSRETTVWMRPGKVVSKPAGGGSPYRVVSCERTK